jgi:glutamate dehydrogenase
MTAQPRLPKTLVDSIRDALTTNALPGETEGFDRKQQRDAAEFIASAAAVRPPKTTAIRSNRPAARPAAGECGWSPSTRTCRSWSTASPEPSLPAALPSTGCSTRSSTSTRDKQGESKSIGEGEPESIIYIELDRADARGRQELARS